MRRFYLLTILIFAVSLYMNRAYAQIYDNSFRSQVEVVPYNSVYLINNSSQKGTVKYMALGDSLTAGVGGNRLGQTYPYLIAQKLTKSFGQVLVTNLSSPGATTADVLKKQLPRVKLEQPDYVTLLIGINDIHNLKSPETFKSDFSQIVTVLEQETKANILVLSIPYLGSEMLILEPYRYILDFRTRQFNETIRQLINNERITYVDLYYQSKQKFNQENFLYSADQFHPSGEGYKYWGELINASSNW